MANLNDFKPGMIVKLTVENFVTHKYAEMFPGENLNLIIGANGTGKSTLIAAIILGLGGNPKTIGRGHKVSEYIKHNCAEAIIEIQLKSNKNDILHLSRHITRDDRSTWQINGKACTQKQFLESILEYNVQVNNLCQFLPQDRVADFAKMNKQELLKQTLKALCQDVLIQQHEDLITAREKHKDLSKGLKSYKDKLENSEKMNLQLESKISAFEDRKKFQDQLDHCERKIVWLTYLKKKELRSETKEERNEASLELKKRQGALQVFDDKIKFSRQKVLPLQDTYTKSLHDLTIYEREFENHYEKLNSLKNSFGTIEKERERKFQENEELKKGLDMLKKKYTLLLRDKNELLTKLGGGEENLEEQYQLVNNNIRKFNVTLNKIQTSISDTNNLMRRKHNEIHGYQKQLETLENVKQKRLDILKSRNHDAYSATLWLRENRNNFKGQVFDPIILEANLYNASHAKYVEASIPILDRVAIICTHKDDFNSLVQILRMERKLKVNIIHSSADIKMDRFTPRIPIEELRSHGFNAYISTIFTAPEPIMTYLCRSYNIHNIPVAFKNAENDNKNLPPGINLFYRGDFKISSKRSQYTNETSMRQVEIHSDKTMEIIIDQSKINNVTQQLNYIKERLEELEAQLKNLNERDQTTNEQINKEREIIQTMRTNRRNVDDLNRRLIDMERKIKENENLEVPILTINETYKKEFESILKNIEKSVQFLIVLESKYQQLLVNCDLVRYDLEHHRTQVINHENDTINERRLVEEAEAKLNTMKDLYNTMTEELKRLLQKGKNMSGGYTPDDAQFDTYREAYDKLSNDCEELYRNKEDILDRISCLRNAASDDELKQYKDGLNNIKRLKESINNYSCDFDNITTNMDKNLQNWLRPVRKIISDINERFTNGFKSINCVGEVDLYIGHNEQDFEEYGLAIRVTYRSDQPLQELNSTTQSGGERAVATAIFMLSLQDLTPVPFRCVDEINQGMDAENELRVFKLLVELTSREDTAQYFLVTPKLVPKLEFVDEMKIHLVHNGPYVLKQTECRFNVNR